MLIDAGATDGFGVHHYISVGIDSERDTRFKRSRREGKLSAGERVYSGVK